jgi:acetate kinase
LKLFLANDQRPTTNNPQQRMKILTLNSGSTSVKFQLFDFDHPERADSAEVCLGRVSIERFGPRAKAARDVSGRPDLRWESEENIPGCREALERAFQLLTEGAEPMLSSLDDIDAAGHRFVHGGDEFRDSVILDDAILGRLEACAELAPLHAPANLEDCRLARELLPNRPHVAVFDTAFHQTMPARARLYALPIELCERLRLRRYGFHGASHRHVHERLSAHLGKAPGEVSSIIIHLGGGCSMTAIRRGQSVDTSMGFTPLEGLVMATRSGDIDPAVIPHIMEHEGLDTHQVVELLNKRAGLAGLSGLSGDMRDLERAAAQGNERAAAAMDVFCYRAKKYIGAYLAALEGETDAIAFSAGIGENSPTIRARCCAGLERLGIQLDPARNAVPNPPVCHPPREGERRVSADSSPIAVFVIPTDEGLVIARDAARLLMARGAFPEAEEPSPKDSVLKKISVS